MPPLPEKSKTGRNRRKESRMKRYYVETEDYSAVLFVDETGRAVVVNDTAFSEPLTLAVAKAADYSSLEGFETAAEAAANYLGETIDFKPEEFSKITEF